VWQVLSNVRVAGNSQTGEEFRRKKRAPAKAGAHALKIAGLKLTRGIAGHGGNASGQPSAPDTTKQITDDERPCNDGNRSFANRSARGLRESRLYLFRLVWNGRCPLGSGRCRVRGAVDGAMCRSAQAVNLGGRLVSDPVGCLVRCMCYVFNLGACWIGAATAASAIARQRGGSIHVSSFQKIRDRDAISLRRPRLRSDYRSSAQALPSDAV
jgi:hypothetical protein